MFVQRIPQVSIVHCLLGEPVQLFTMCVLGSGFKPRSFSGFEPTDSSTVSKTGFGLQTKVVGTNLTPGFGFTERSFSGVGSTNTNAVSWARSRGVKLD